MKVNFSLRDILRMKILSKSFLEDSDSISEAIDKILKVGLSLQPERYLEEKFVKLHHCKISQENHEKIKYLAKKYQISNSEATEILISNVLADIVSYAPKKDFD